MKEEISLYDIIYELWKSKWSVSLFTIVPLIISLFVSLVLVSPTYEASSTVRVENVENQYLKSFVESIKSDVSINRVINKLNLDRNFYTIQSIREVLKVDVIENTNVIRVRVRGSDPSIITDISNLMAFELGARVEISDRSQKIVTFKEQLRNTNNAIAVGEKELNEINNQLSVTPEKIVVRQSLADNPFLQSYVQENTSISIEQVASLELQSESINPVFTSLKAKIADTTVTLAANLATKENLEKDMQENETKIAELEQRINQDKLRAVNSERMLDGFNAVFISPSIQPIEPASPNVLANSAAGAFIGFLVGATFVILRKYWIHNKK